MDDGQAFGESVDRGAARKLDSQAGRKFWIALGLYAVLAAAIWFSFGESTVFVFGRVVELKLIPLFIVGTFAFRTVLAREADKIRREADRDGETGPDGKL